MKQNCPILLASASPRRRDLLARAGITFTVQTSEIEESVQAFSTPKEAVKELAQRKAVAVYERYAKGKGVVVLAADTLVSLGRLLLGKPEDKAHARDMLEALSGRTHQVQTGVCILLPSGLRITFCDQTDVTFRELAPEEIVSYLATDEPMDKAGAYAIQGGAAKFVRKIQGDYNNVVGLPIDHVRTLLKQLHVCAEEDF